MHESAVYLKPVSFVPERTRRRVERALLAEAKTSADATRQLTRRITDRRSQYKRDLLELMGRGNMRRYRQLRKETADAPRAKRIREARRFLESAGFDFSRGDRLRATYLRDTQELRAPVTTKPPRGRLPLDECSPWVTYMAPYHGWSWAFVWSRSDEPDDPELTRYLDVADGTVGSSVGTRVSGADDDDFLTAEYYTGLNVWHTTLATGILEVYLAFEFNTSPYSGKVTDEFGFSDATYQQWASADLRVSDTQGAFERQDSRMLNHVDTAWGDDQSWSDIVFKPRDRHWYFYRTTVGFQQGTAVLIEAGVYNLAWFTCNDQSIRTLDDLNLRLDRIMVRTCPGPIIL